MKHSSLSQTAFVGILFQALIASVILIHHPPVSKPPVTSAPLIIQKLLEGKDPFIPSGEIFSAFKPFLPPHEKVTFIMDYPFSPYGRGIDQLYEAQSHLAPTILSHDPDQRAAIVFCSNTSIAEKRLEESGYRILAPLGDGKGVAIKK